MLVSMSRSRPRHSDTPSTHISCLKTSGTERFSVQRSTSLTLSASPVSGAGFDYPTVQRVVSSSRLLPAAKKIASTVIRVLNLIEPCLGRKFPPTLRRIQKGLSGGG